MMMHQQQKFRCIETTELRAVRLDYKTKGVHAWFVMGNIASDADNALEKFLEIFVNSGQHVEDKEIDLKIPRFKAVMNIDLKQAFSKTQPAITSIFKEGHLRNMSGNEKERFSTFEHMCYVQVDEKGTDAGVV
jgi:serine protease inhibitor